MFIVRSGNVQPGSGFQPLRVSRAPRRWFDALELRSTYSASQSDHYTHCHDIPPQYGPGYAAEGTAAFAMAINGTDGESWRLPLPPITLDSLEYRSNIIDGGLVRNSTTLSSRQSCVWL